MEPEATVPTRQKPLYTPTTSVFDFDTVIIELPVEITKNNLEATGRVRKKKERELYGVEERERELSLIHI